MIQLKRVYEKAAAGDGYRVLVDRLWPRGMNKETAKIDLWMKEVAPGDELRRWFSHEEKKWTEFLKRYRSELAKKKALIEELKNLEKEHGKLTLLFGAKDEKCNQAVALKAVLEKGG